MDFAFLSLTFKPFRNFGNFTVHAKTMSTKAVWQTGQVCLSVKAWYLVSEGIVGSQNQEKSPGYSCVVRESKILPGPNISISSSGALVLFFRQLPSPFSLADLVCLGECLRQYHWRLSLWTAAFVLRLSV